MKNLLSFFLLNICIAGGAYSQVPFEPMEPNYTSTTVLTSASLEEKTLFREGQHWLRQETENGYVGVATAPSQHDYMFYEPTLKHNRVKKGIKKIKKRLDKPHGNKSNRGYLVINFERSTLRSERPELGEGGGMAIVQVEQIADEWRIFNDPVLGDTSVSVDFSPVGWTTTNCGGTKLPNGHHLTGEEIFSNFDSNEMIEKNFTLHNPEVGYVNGVYTIPAGYPEFGGMQIKMHENFGWMTEIDPSSAKALHKNYHMGRFSHEGGIAMPDNRTIYLTDDFVPSCLFKFVADQPNDYRMGNLYAFKQDDNSNQGSWVQIPRNLPALINARDEAIKLGATLFMRLEWGALNTTNGKVYLAETGNDNADLNSFQENYDILKIPKHWKDGGIWNEETKIADHPYGAVLELDDRDPDKPSVKSYLNGGTSSNGKLNFASVDGISFVTIGNKDWFIFQEDLIGTTRGRMPEGINYTIPEAFFLDASIESPAIDDLHLVFAGSQGAEVTGACFSPDGTTMFINNQHPSSVSNLAPYDRSATIAVTGFDKHLVNIPEIDSEAKNFVIYPNPVFQAIHFNKAVDVILTDKDGNQVAKRDNCTSLDVFYLPKGVYFLRTSLGETHRIILE